MSKKRMIIFTSVILSVVVISLGIVKLYQTYALGNYIDTASSATFDVNITRDTSVRIPANGYSNVFYMVTNTSPGTVRYGVAYTTDSNVTVKTFSTSKYPASGVIEENEKKYVKLRLENTSSTIKNITLSTVLGYENGGDLIPPSGVTLVTKKYYANTISLAKYITNLYTGAEKEMVTNNDITYNTAPSVSLMNDRLGDTTTDLDGGNIRYYGASPNNYIYFNCETYPDTNCEIWRIIGVFDGKLKIIRNESIGSYSWDNKNDTEVSSENSGSNDWTTSELMKILNPRTYYQAGDYNSYGLYYDSLAGLCPYYTDENNNTQYCDFSENTDNISGLKNDDTRNMIMEMEWNLGGYFGNPNVYPNVIYESERGTTVYTERPTTWIGKIALAYPSDYGYATDLSKCTQTFNGYGDSNCTSNSWLTFFDTLPDDVTAFALLSPSAEFASKFSSILRNGIMNFENYTIDIYSIYPTLFLNLDLEIASGDGSESSPYGILPSDSSS